MSTGAVKTGAVTGIYVVSDSTSSNYGQTLVNVDTGGPDGTAGIVNGLPGYFPQVGDVVAILDIGGQWLVIGCTTPNRGLNIARSTIKAQNSAPAGYDQISTVYAQHGVDDEPAIVMVRASAVTPVGGTLVTPASSGHSYRYDFGGSWSTDNARIYQGSYSGFGPWAGLWFYPSMTAALSGKTITGITMHLHRANQGGSAGAVQLHMYLHNHASQPAGAPSLTNGPTDLVAMSWGAEQDVALPLAWAQALQAGTAAGIGIYATDQDSYAILLGPDEDGTSGQLSITYS